MVRLFKKIYNFLYDYWNLVYYRAEFNLIIIIIFLLIEFIILYYVIKIWLSIQELSDLLKSILTQV